jgi:hypothetical protein
VVENELDAALGHDILVVEGDAVRGVDVELEPTLANGSIQTWPEELGPTE